MTVKECDTCHETWPLDRYRDDGPAPDSCFRCRSKGISFGFQGGKEYFHEDTERRRTEKALSEARAAGFDPVPTETRGSWGGIGAKTLDKIGEVSKKNGAFGGKPAANAGTSGTTTAGKVS